MAKKLTQGEKLHRTMVAKFGSEEAYKQYLRDRGRKGGAHKVPKGFAVLGREHASKAGTIGGKAKRVSK